MHHACSLNNNFSFISLLFFPLFLFWPFQPERTLTSTACFSQSVLQHTYWNGVSAAVPRLIALELAYRSSPNHSLCLLSKEMKNVHCCTGAFECLQKVCHKSALAFCTCSVAFCSLPGINSRWSLLEEYFTQVKLLRD